ncbi:Cytochrome c [Rubripirellula obstinata]|uniref:Cytochrome c n=1 Tax=Rubripirellula obstinata TaxID=406547 RepID=A0A5B1CL39_9BACT|nr:PVC-type heme-binding CxxCH protein [Rubripirellula obstinata]KAA1261052.1 Cytochrome c [Rubripirellula obstinata]
MRTTILFLCLTLYPSTLPLSVGHADFPVPYNTEPTSDETLMPADQAAAKMSVPDGFRVTAFAAEPDVQNPIASAWDSRGRLWVAENYTYAERSQKFQLDLRDRIIVFDGTDKGKFNKRTVFTDNVQMLTGVEVGRHGKRHGVWMMCPPKLIFVPDEDRDDVPDNDGEVVLDGFKVAESNYHNFANGIRFGPDGWLYGRCGGSCPGRIGKPGTPDDQRLALEGGMWRYHPDRGDVEVLTTGTTNPWGHDFNDVGEGFFINTVNGHFWHMIPGAHFTRPFTLDPNRKTFELIDFHADHWHFDTGGAWHESRDGVANSYGGGHAHCGAMIYQGGSWPEEYHGNLFTLNFHGRRVNQEVIRRKGSGYVASHAEDLFLSADPWFRGMEITSGPDGNAFILDWSDAGECHEHTGVHRTSGRIFKVIGPVNETSKVAKLDELDVALWNQKSLAETVSGENVWFRRQASLELARRAAGGDRLLEAKSLLRDVINRSEDHRQVVQAMLMMNAMGDWVTNFQHANEHVRAASIRIATERLPLDDALGMQSKPPPSVTTRMIETKLLPKLETMAQHDPSQLVQLTLASSLQRLSILGRARIAKQLCKRSDAEGDHNLPLMIWYGLIPVAQSQPELLVDVAQTCKLSITLRLISRSLAEQIGTEAAPVNDLIDQTLASKIPSHQSSVLAGLSEGLRGWRKAPRPDAWDADILEELSRKIPDTLAPMINELSVVFGDGRAVEELMSVATGKTPADYASRNAALATLIQTDAPGIKDVCQSLLKNAKINVTAAGGLARYEDPELGRILTARYRNFRAPDRPKLMSILVSRKSFAMPMLAAMSKGKIQRDALTPYHVRQMIGLGDQELNETISRVWGTINDTPKAIDQRIADLKQLLGEPVLAGADKSNGRVLFTKLCQSCHQLYGEGSHIGPDLTGAGRSNLDYLLDNIVAPSRVVDKDYRMTMILTDDDRIVSGLVTGENDRVITVQTATEVQRIEKDKVAERKLTDKSPMPDGLLDGLSDSEVMDLIAYLRHPTQVALPGSQSTGDSSGTDVERN